MTLFLGVFLATGGAESRPDFLGLFSEFEQERVGVVFCVLQVEGGVFEGMQSLLQEHPLVPVLHLQQ